MSDGTQTLSMADALAQAKTELSPATESAAEPDMPSDEAQVAASIEEASTERAEQPAADENGFSPESIELAEALMTTSEESQNGSESGAIVPGSDDFWNLSVDVETVNGPESVSIRDLTDGYLRQADYTKKTQALSTERQRLEKSESFLKAFEENPANFARSLAIQAGFIDEGSTPVKHVDVARIPTPDEFEARVNEVVEQRIKEDPTFREAEVVTARAQVDAEFDRLEKAYEVPLSKDLRDDLIREASQRGSADLEGLLTRRLVNAQKSRSSSNFASTSRPGAPPAAATQPTEANKGGDKPNMREAWAQAKVAATQQ